MKIHPFSALGALLLIGMQSASAVTIVDLTSASSSGTINSAWFVQIDPTATGTGAIDSFVQISGSGNLDETHAYNTTNNNTLNNGSADNFNHSITLGDVPIVTDPTGVGIMGDFYQFMLDINENNNRFGDQFLSIDEIQLFAGGTANSSVETFTSGVLDHDGTLVYQLDAGMDNWIALNYALNTGSGSGDMFMYVPTSTFAGFSSTDVVTLYSHFGGAGVDPSDGMGGNFTGNFHTSDGFEEWAVLTSDGPGTSVPDGGASLALLGLAMGGMGLFRRMSRNK